MTVIIVALFHHSAFGIEKKVVLDSLVLDAGQLRLSYHVEGLLDSKMTEGLQKGFTSEIVHHVCLWKSKKVISSISSEIIYPVKVFYDEWQSKYAVATTTESRLTAHLETVDEMCSGLRHFALCDTSSLDEEAKYYLTIEVKIQPISNESYQELRDWISGSTDKQDERPQKAKRGRFAGMLMDMMGLGDKTLLHKSKDFVITGKRTIDFIE